ncbi:MAG: HD domain-containing protein, partial [Thermodesulfobacteriota bacterium]|nr:HD domain-containing protein [Thermodesulfobacteriota bacterium]
PLRVFRAARFYATWPDFTAHSELISLMRQTAHAGLLEKIAPERVGVETRRALAGPLPGRFLWLLSEARCLEPWFMEFVQAGQIPAGPAPYHTESLLAHTIQVMDRLAGSELVAWMGLCHDLGKAATPAIHHPRHIGHEGLGESLAARLGERLRLPEKFIQAGAEASKWHMKAGRYGELRPGTKVDMLVCLHARGLVDEMFALALADHDRDFLAQANKDLSAILSVRLPEEDRDQGPASGEKLRLLRCQALAGAG